MINLVLNKGHQMGLNHDFLLSIIEFIKEIHYSNTEGEMESKTF